MLAPDIETQIRRQAVGDAEVFLNRFRAFTDENPDFGDRVFRCAVFVSQGDLSRLEAAIRMAKLDWRDLILSAEYEPKPGTKRSLGDYVQVRDFNCPFK